MYLRLHPSSILTLDTLNSNGRPFPIAARTGISLQSSIIERKLHLIFCCSPVVLGFRQDSWYDEILTQTEPNQERALLSLAFSFSKIGALPAFRLGGGRLSLACSDRFELGNDHDAGDRFIDYIDDYGFFGGFG